MIYFSEFLISSRDFVEGSRKSIIQEYNENPGELEELWQKFMASCNKKFVVNLLNDGFLQYELCKNSSKEGIFFEKREYPLNGRTVCCLKVAKHLLR